MCTHSLIHSPLTHTQLLSVANSSASTAAVMHLIDRQQQPIVDVECCARSAAAAGVGKHHQVLNRYQFATGKYQLSVGSGIKHQHPVGCVTINHPSTGKFQVPTLNCLCCSTLAVKHKFIKSQLTVVVNTYTAQLCTEEQSIDQLTCTSFVHTCARRQRFQSRMCSNPFPRTAD